MAKKNDRKNQPPFPPPPPSLAQPKFSAPPAPAVIRPPPVSRPVSNPNVKGKGNAKAKDQSSTGIAETLPQPPNPPNIRLQGPVRWVYNYDHTDPLNFGFMFPVTSGSSTDLSTLNAHPMSSSISSVAPAPTRGPIGNFPSSPVRIPPESSAWGQLQWSLSPGESGLEDQQFLGSQQQILANASHQHLNFPHQSLSHRYSPNRDFSQTSSIQQLAPSEDQVW